MVDGLIGCGAVGIFVGGIILGFVVDVFVFNTLGAAVEAAVKWSDSARTNSSKHTSHTSQVNTS